MPRLFTILIFTLFVGTISAQYQYLGTYDNQGRPNYLIAPPDVVSIPFKAAITATLPESRPIPIYNPVLIAPGRTETINVTCASDVWISFVDEGASYLNALGFYTFSLDNPPTVAPPASQIKIIFPNASKSGFGGALNAGDKVYIGNFPARTGIGFVLMADGWDGNIVTPGRWTLYSNSAFNPEADPTLRKHTVILRDTATNRFVIGFEDIRRDDPSCDQDFNDMLFFATVTPVTCVDKIDSIPDLTDDGHISFSGNTGGLESKSLGDKIAKRVFRKAVEGNNGEINYAKFLTLDQEQQSIRGNNTGGGLKLADIMPNRVLDPGHTAYVSTPADIPSITNAKEVRSIDFVQSGVCRAVAFATKTLGIMYDHTKPICDRLKGAELLGMDNFNLNGLNFVRYTLRQETGNIEYAMSFTVGKKAGRNNFSFQSNWLNKDYVTEDTLFNYQIWGVAPYLCVDMALDILTKLKAIMPVEQRTASAALPKTYITTGIRKGLSLNLTIENETTVTGGYLELEESANEQSTIKTKRVVPLTIQANGKTAISFPITDAFESNVSLFVNGKLQDVVYMSDGTWGIDYDTSKTILKKHIISNDSARVFLDEYPVFRNVQMQAITPGYITAFKVLRGAGAPQNLSDYKTLSFKAKGNSNLRITLVKNSITDFSKQYQIILPVGTELRDYKINLTDFKSSGNGATIDATDITTIVFAFETTDGKQTEIDAVLNTVAFSKKSIAFLTSIEQQEIHVYPNPVKSKGLIYAAFRSEENTNATIRIVEVASGKTVYSKQIGATKGDNTIPVQLGNTSAGAVYMLSVEGIGLSLKPMKLIIN